MSLSVLKFAEMSTMLIFRLKSNLILSILPLRSDEVVASATSAALCDYAYLSSQYYVSFIVCKSLLSVTSIFLVTL
jgi:hypothetical protein